MSIHNSAITSDTGKGAAIVVYVLYLFSLPTIGFLMLLGVVFAYISRGKAAPWVRTHFDKAIKLFWTTFWWTVLGGVIFLLGFVLSIVGIGLIILWGLGIAGTVLAIWFHVVAAIDLLRLLQDKHA